jgi:hypothetical protein
MPIGGVSLATRIPSSSLHGCCIEPAAYVGWVSITAVAITRYIWIGDEVVPRKNPSSKLFVHHDARINDCNHHAGASAIPPALK